MNLPNKITIARTLLILPLVILLHMGEGWCRWAALGVFIIAAVTDFLDGHIARKYHLVTNFGKFLDPVADKLLVLSSMVCLCGLGEFPAWLCVLVLFRELAVDGLRLVASQQGIVIAAGPLGKLKTNVQLITAGWCISGLSKLLSFGGLVNWVLWILTAVMTLWSGIDYFVRNRSLLSQK